DKVYAESNKLLGMLKDGNVQQGDIPIDATCNRVGVRDGHLEAVSIAFKNPPREMGEVIEALRSFRGIPQANELPSAPRQPIVVHEDPSRPQPILDRMNGGGMAVTVGRVKPSRV